MRRMWILKRKVSRLKNLLWARSIIMLAQDEEMSHTTDQYFKRTNKGTNKIFDQRQELKMLKCAVYELQEFESFEARNFNIFEGA